MQRWLYIVTIKLVFYRTWWPIYVSGNPALPAFFTVKLTAQKSSFEETFLLFYSSIEHCTMLKHR